MNAPTTSLVALLTKLPKDNTELQNLTNAVCTLLKIRGSQQLLLQGPNCLPNLVKLMFGMATPEQFQAFLDWVDEVTFELPYQFLALIKEALLNANENQIRATVAAGAYTPAYDKHSTVHLVDELVKDTMLSQSLFEFLVGHGFETKEPVKKQPQSAVDFLLEVPKKIAEGAAPTLYDEAMVARLFTNQLTMTMDDGLLKLTMEHKNTAWFKLFSLHVK